MTAYALINKKINMRIKYGESWMYGYDEIDLMKTCW